MYPRHGLVISLIPDLISSTVSILISLSLAYLTIKLLTLDKINNFLYLTVKKVLITLILVLLALTPVYLSEFGIIKLNYILKQILTFHSIIFSGIFEFMESLFPIIIYYVIVCLVSYLSSNQNNLQYET